jgi:hypothetical protein
LFAEFDGDRGSLYRERVEAHLHERQPAFATIVIDTQVIRGGSHAMGSD